MGKLRCIYIDNKPLPNVKVLLIRGSSLARVVVIIDNDYYVFTFKEEALEYLRQRLGVEDFEIRPCPN
jgi:hypothetical protein